MKKLKQPAREFGKGIIVIKQKVVNGQYINSRLISGDHFVNVEAKGEVYKTTIVK